MSEEINKAVDEMRTFVASRPAPDVRAAVMSRIQALDSSGVHPYPSIFRRFAAFLWTPREVAIRPALAVTGTLAVLALLLVPYLGERGETELTIYRNADPQLLVQFRLEASASRVQLAGSFTNWEPRFDLREYAPGIWTITVPLAEGVHDYAFVVDGNQWTPDPFAPQIGDGFGGTNSRLTLLAPSTPQL